MSLDRPNIIPTRDELEHGAIRLGMPSGGRLAEPAMALFHDAELPLKRKGDRCSVGFSARTYEALRVRFLRPDDAVVFTQLGSLDVAIVAQNLVAEYGGDNVDEVLPLDFGQCSLVLAVPADSDIDCVRKLSGRKIATSYPRITGRFCSDNGISDVEILNVKGAVEGYPLVGLTESIVDVSESGESLRQNGLVVLATIMETRAVFIVNKMLNDMQRDNVDFIRDSLVGAMLARMYTKTVCRFVDSDVTNARFREFVEFYSDERRGYFLDGDVERISSDSGMVTYQFFCLDGEVSKIMKVLAHGRLVKRADDDPILSGIPDVRIELSKPSMIYRRKK